MHMPGAHLHDRAGSRVLFAHCGRNGSVGLLVGTVMPIPQRVAE